MSEQITHTAIVDDCARLTRWAPDICDAFKTTIAADLEIARLGGITRHGDRHNPGLLTRLREVWPDPSEMERRKLVFVLGWLSHRAADRTMKIVFRTLDPDCPDRPPTDCSIYHDVTVYREVYSGGARDPYVPGGLEPEFADHPAAAGLDVEALEDLLWASWQRMLLVMHTFIPDDDNIDPWLENVIARRQRLYVELRRYAEAFAKPDPDKVKRFVEEPNFYNPDDDLIRFARSLQLGDAVEHIDFEKALADAPSASLYAKALGRAFGYTRAASAYFEKSIDLDTLKKRLEIGRAELSG